MHFQDLAIHINRNDKHLCVTHEIKCTKPQIFHCSNTEPVKNCQNASQSAFSHQTYQEKHIPLTIVVWRQEGIQPAKNLTPAIAKGSPFEELWGSNLTCSNLMAS